MRGLLIANPRSTRADPSVTDWVLEQLSKTVKLDVATTMHREHASDLAAQAAVDEVDVVVVVGGDGTVNETVCGLLRDGPRSGLPALGVVPRGSADVFARNLGLARRVDAAVQHIAAGLASKRRRSISLGRCSGRWFCFAAGMGFDASVVADVEAHRDAGGRASTTRYIERALRAYLTDPVRREARITVQVDDREPVDHLMLAIVCKSTPWTYAGPVALHATPLASYETQLDLLALRPMKPARVMLEMARLFSSRRILPRGRHVVHVHDAARIVLTADRPMPWQVDGDGMGTADRLEMESVPDALTVVA